MSLPLKCPRCGHDWYAHDEWGKCRIALNEPPSCGACRQELSKLENLRSMNVLDEADLFRVEKRTLSDPEREPEQRRVIHYKRVWWCVVENREGHTVADVDTDHYWCESNGHKIGEDGCMFRDVLVLGYERE